MIQQIPRPNLPPQHISPLRRQPPIISLLQMCLPEPSFSIPLPGVLTVLPHMRTHRIHPMLPYASLNQPTQQCGRNTITPVWRQHPQSTDIQYLILGGSLSRGVGEDAAAYCAYYFAWMRGGG